MAKSKFFCVAVEGGTTDGRVIEGAWIEEMAANYNPATYTANINIEHIKGYSPEKPFNNYGSILALEKREIELSINGKTEKRKALFAQVDGNDQLVALSKAKQKRFPSIEVNPNFAGQGQAYCVGLGMTDSPASLGTEMLAFAANAAVNPLASRKQHPGNVFSAADGVEPVVIEFEDEGAPEGKTFSLDAVLAAAARHFTGKQEPVAPAAPKQEPATPALPTAQDFTAGFNTLGEGLKAMSDAFNQAQLRNEQTMSQLQSEFAALKKDVEGTPERTYASRPTHAGGNGIEQTDC